MIWAFVGIAAIIVVFLAYCRFIYRRDATVDIPNVEMCKKLQDPQSWSVEDMEECANFLVTMGLTESKYECTLNLGLWKEYHDYFESRHLRYRFEYQTLRAALFTWFSLPMLKLGRPSYEKMKQMLIDSIMENTTAPENEIFRDEVIEYWKLFTEKFGKNDVKLVVAALFCTKLGMKLEHEIGQKITNLIVPNLVDCVFIQIEKMLEC